MKAEKGTNPKDKLGSLKLSVGYLPGPGLIYASLGMMNGAIKYDKFNWRDNKVLLSVYIDANARHNMLIASGEWICPKSGVPHAGHIAANCMIIADAYEHGCLVNDVPQGDVTPALLDKWNKEIETVLLPKWKAERAAREKANETDSNSDGSVHYPGASGFSR